MTYNHTTRNDCRLCLSENIERVVELPDTIPGEHLKSSKCDPDPELLEISLFQCKDCGHVQINSVPDPNSLFNEHYSFMPSKNPEIIKHFETTINYILEHHVRELNFAFEFGSNDGLFLDLVREKTNAKVLGMDPSLPPVEEAHKRNIETIHDFFGKGSDEQILSSHGSPDLIIANNVFAHIDDLRGILRTVSNMIKDEGFFVFEVSYLLDIVDRYLIGTIIHEHLSHHSVYSLIPFLQSEGFQLVDVVNVSKIQGGAIVCVAKKTLSSKIYSSVDKNLELETMAGINNSAGMKNFESRLKSKLDDFKTQLIKFYSNKKLFAYGAARSAPFIMQLLEINNVVEYCIDDHPQKQGKFLPISNAEITDSTVLKDQEKMRDACFVITGWAQTERIISHLADRGYHEIASICPSFCLKQSL